MCRIKYKSRNFFFGQKFIEDREMSTQEEIDANKLVPETMLFFLSFFFVLTMPVNHLLGVQPNNARTKKTKKQKKTIHFSQILLLILTNQGRLSFTLGVEFVIYSLTPQDMLLFFFSVWMNWLLKK